MGRLCGWLTALIAIAAVAACGGSGSSTPSSGTTSATSTQPVTSSPASAVSAVPPPAGFPTGTYTARCSSICVKPGAPPLTLTLVLDAAGRGQEDSTGTTN